MFIMYLSKLNSRTKQAVFVVKRRGVNKWVKMLIDM